MTLLASVRYEASGPVIVLYHVVLKYVDVASMIDEMPDGVVFEESGQG
jgi:hypothetical protein